MLALAMAIPSALEGEHAGAILSLVMVNEREALQQGLAQWLSTWGCDIMQGRGHDTDHTSHFQAQRSVWWLTWPGVESILLL